ncbi:MAG: T9SS C-terminal target domain-containing protein [Bacteroidetes bacterium]|nr:MAG: T9SS C-terminal target domain-containing protein [Bacteroidota bacterium]
MNRLLNGLTAAALSCLVYTGGHAQPSVALPDGTEDASEVVQRLVEAEHASRRAAVDWAHRHRLPRRIPQPDGRVIELAGMDGSRPIYLTTWNRTAAHFTGTSTLYPGGPLGLALTGHGLRLGLWDEGHPLRDHQEFTGRITPGDDGRPQNHATHVAGTLMAAGIRPEARGMAYAADLVAYDWSNDTVEMTTEAARGLLVSNHSYGMVAGWHYGDLEGTGSGWYWNGDPTISTTEDYAFGWYGSEAVQFDQVAHTYPFLLPVVAAGNDRADTGPRSGTYRAYTADGAWATFSVDARPIPPDGGAQGYDTIAGAAVAKNVLTVGSVGGDPTGGFRVSPFSSFGPTDDGRVKPDLVGYGEEVFSTLATGINRYAFYSGTSMATPNVAGTLLLLQEHMANLLGTSLRAASLKGLVLHTARDLGPPGPDYQYGWGLLDAEAAARQLSAALSNPLALLETTLPDGGTFTQTATVDSAGPLRITLSWTDPPSARRPLQGPSSLDDPTPHLKHDLDVRLIHDASGTVYLPFVLDPGAPEAPAAPGDNRVDPIEQIYLPEALAGSYTIRVSHKGSLTAGRPQPFTLLVSGAADVVRPVVVARFSAQPDLDGVTLRWETVFERSTGQFVIERLPLTVGDEGQILPGPVTPVDVLPTLGTTETPRVYTFTDAQVPTGYYRYRIRYEEPGRRYVAAEIEVVVPAPERVAVLSNYPNPFSHRTTLVLDLVAETPVRVAVFDALGRRVAVLRDEVLPAGRHHLPLDASAWAPGLYVARVQTERATVSHPLLRLP